MIMKKLFGVKNKIQHLLLNKILPDDVVLKLLFRKKMGKKLDLRNPKTLNEKIQWLKLYDRKDIYKVYADKYRVREIIKSKIGDEYLIPLLAIFEHPRDIIDVNSLPPPPYIIKNNHDNSGGIIVRDYKNFDLEMAKARLLKNIEREHYSSGKEWQYKDIPRKIIVEKLLVDKSNRIPNDYKFNCFNGRVEFIYVSIDREGQNYRKIYNRDWEETDITWTYRGNEKKKFSGPGIDKPSNFDEMIRIAEILSADFKYVRIDLYNLDGAIYFGEVTLHHGSGFEPILPEHYDYYYGSLISLNK